MIPDQLHSLFWEIDLQVFEPQLYPEYTIGRVLELGDMEAVSWMRQSFPAESIISVIRNDKRLSRKSAGFWALMYSIPAEEIAALRKAPQ